LANKKWIPQKSAELFHTFSTLFHIPKTRVKKTLLLIISDLHFHASFGTLVAFY